jgi:hypothetical protein
VQKDNCKVVMAGVPQPKRDWRTLLKEFIDEDTNGNDLQVYAPSDKQVIFNIDVHHYSLDEIREAYEVMTKKQKMQPRWRNKEKARKIVWNSLWKNHNLPNATFKFLK